MRVSYCLGNEPAEWRTDVPVWAGVRYVELYPGLDLKTSGRLPRHRQHHLRKRPDALTMSVNANHLCRWAGTPLLSQPPAARPNTWFLARPSPAAGENICLHTDFRR